jgi:hypothetical protein
VYSAVIFQPAYKYLAFKINQEYIVEALCVEREMEVNTCQGGCYLGKEMDTSKNDLSQGTVPTKIKIPELQLEFVVFNNSDSKLFLNTYTISNNICYRTLNKYYQPPTPPPKC